MTSSTHKDAVVTGGTAEIDSGQSNRRTEPECPRQLLQYVLAWAASAFVLVACAADESVSDDRIRQLPRAPIGGAAVGVSGAGAAAAAGTSGNFDNPTHTTAPIVDAPAADTGNPEGKCGAVTQMAENKLEPADIIFGVDTSGSMSEEVAQVQQNLNAFSQQIISSGVDVHVIMLAALQGSALAGGVTVDGPCIAPPLGSGQCPADSKEPAYVHIDQAVGSWDVLDVYVNAYPKYKPHLREKATKTFVTISDDNADSATSPFAALGALVGMQPVLHSADAFINAVQKLEPSAPAMWSKWRYSGIYSFTMCESAQFGAVGTVHQELVKRTGGVAGDLCLQEFAPVFNELAKQVVASATLACDWEIPASPQTGTFDPGKTNVQLTLDGAQQPLFKVASIAACGDREGWHYDDETKPTKVVVCPATCTRIQKVAKAQVDLLFGCQTLTVD